MTKLLEVRALSVAYGSAVAIDGVSFDISRGEFVTVIGPNGAGKTTLLNAIMGVLRAQSGQVMFDGQNLAGMKTEHRVAQGLCIVPERRELFVRLTVEDNLRLGGYLRHRQTANGVGPSLEQIYSILPKLAERRRQLAGTLSGGEQQMVAIGRALMANPRVLMLDEPSSGLAPRIIEEIFEALVLLKRQGMTGVVVEQNARLALDIADRAFVLEVGNIVLSGAAADLRSDPHVTEIYLGGGKRYLDTSNP